MKNNLNKQNLIPFLNGVVDTKEFNFKDFIFEELPLVPTIYFKGKNDDPIGTKIINNFYTIKFNLEKLENIKKIMLSILLTSKCELEKIKISNNKYKLLKKYLIINFNNTFEETFKKETILNKDKNIYKKNNNMTTFTEFLTKFINNNHNILQNYNNNYPYFYTIFENEFNNEESKDYFLKLFTKYNDIRSKLLLYLKINDNNNTNQLSDTSYGIYSFNFMFDILNNTNKSDGNNNKNNCNNKQYENYLINIKNKSSSDNDKYKVLDRVKVNGEEGVIIGIDYFGSPKTPFSVQFSDNKIIKYSLSSLDEIPLEKKIKPTLNPKIRLYDSMYYNKNSSDFYKNNHINNMDKLYKNVITSINHSFENGSSSLYDVIVNNLNLDFNLIKFIFCYVEPKIYNKAIDSYYRVNEYIYNNINSFNSYYDDYIRWYNKLLGLTILDSNIKINFTEESNFEDFYNNLITKL